MSSASKQLIFSTILSSFLSTSGFDTKIAELASTTVESSISVFNTIASDLLPTPSKSHYTFNLRDLAKIFQGEKDSCERQIMSLFFDSQYLLLLLNA